MLQTEIDRRLLAMHVALAAFYGQQIEVSYTRSSNPLLTNHACTICLHRGGLNLSYLAKGKLSADVAGLFDEAEAKVAKIVADHAALTAEFTGPLVGASAQAA